MLLVIRHQIVQREPVVRRHKVDAVLWFSPPRLVNVRGPAEALREVARLAVRALDEHSDDVAEASVPFGPDAPVREGADLVQAAAVPRLRDQLRGGSTIRSKRGDKVRDQGNQRGS